MKRHRQTPGKLTTNNVIMETHEYITINTLLSEGNDIELVQKSRTPHSKSPDITMLGKFWEMKAPLGKTSRSIEHALRRATRQAPNIVIDLRRAAVPEQTSLALLIRLFHELRSIRQLWIIQKNHQILKFKK